MPANGFSVTSSPIANRYPASNVVPTPTPFALPCRLVGDSRICRLVAIWLGPAAIRKSSTAAPGVQLA